MTSVVTYGTRRPGAARRFELRAAARLITTSAGSTTATITRSTEMYTIHEALARERIRAMQRDGQQRRVAKELAASRRWHRVELMASAAGRRASAAKRRHAGRVVG